MSHAGRLSTRRQRVFCVSVPHHRSPLIRPADQHHDHRQTQNGPHGVWRRRRCATVRFENEFTLRTCEIWSGCWLVRSSGLHWSLPDTGHAYLLARRLFVANRRRPRVRPWIFVQYQGRVIRYHLSVVWRSYAGAIKASVSLITPPVRLYHVPDF